MLTLTVHVSNPSVNLTVNIGDNNRKLMGRATMILSTIIVIGVPQPPWDEVDVTQIMMDKSFLGHVLMIPESSQRTHK